MYQFYFLKLSVWENAKELSKEVYKISTSFPEEERFNIIGQIRRASISICSNIAEGSSRTSGKEQARFTDIAYGSLLEVLNLLIISKEFEFLKEDSLLKLQQKIEVIARQLIALIKTQRSREIT